MLKIAIAGLGAISGTHINAVKNLPNAQLVAVCDINAAKANLVPNAAFYTGIEEMLVKEQPDCLHICLPHHLHVPAAKLAAQHGVHVFMEKPSGLNVNDLQPLLTIEQDYGIKLGICLQNRYNQTSVKLAELLTLGTYGAVKGCKAVLTWNRGKDYYNNDPWRGIKAQAGSGVLLSQAIHTIDLMCLLCGSTVWVKGLCGNLLHEDIEVEDTAAAHIAFENNISGIFYGSVTHCMDSSVEIEVVCEKAVLTIKNETLIVNDNESTKIAASDEVLQNGKRYYGASHQKAIANFYNAIENNENTYITIQNSVPSIALIDAIVESAKKQKKIVLPATRFTAT